MQVISVTYWLIFSTENFHRFLVQVTLIYYKDASQTATVFSTHATNGRRSHFR